MIHRRFLFQLLLVVLQFQTVLAQTWPADSMIMHTFGTGDYRASDLNYSATEDANGIMYFANENGLLEYDGSQWRLHTLPDYSYIYTCEAARDGRIYTAGYNEFGYMERDSLGNMAYTSVRDLLDLDQNLEEIWQIYFHKGQVYFMSYQGIVRWDGELPHFLPEKNVWFIHKNESLFVSVIDKGLARMENDSLVYLNTDLRFENDNPLILLPFKGREKLLPTEYNGIFLVDTVTFESRKWESEAGQLFDEKGLWMAEVWDEDTYLFSVLNHSLTWMDKSGNIVAQITEEDRLTTDEFLNFFQDSRGNLWLPGYSLHHFVWPQKQRLETTNTLIRYLEVEEMVEQVNRNVDTVNIQSPEPLRNFLVHFAVPGVNIVDLEFSTMLEGFDAKWSPWNSNPRKEYTNLDGGDYTFRVRARTVGGYNFQPASLYFVVPTPWYGTPWGKLLVGMLMWFILLGIYKLRTRTLKRKNEQLEEVVEAKTVELRKTNKKLEMKNQELDQFVRRVSHDLVAPMKSVMALMDITREEKNDTEQERCFDMMKMSLLKQEQFVQRMLDQAVNYREVRCVDVRPAKLCKDAVHSLSHFEGMKELDIRIEIPDDFQFKSDPDRLRIVFTNLITNAIKYRKLDGEPSMLTISHRLETPWIYLSFKDNGTGIKETQKKKIFEMFKRASDQSQGTGLGLYITQDMMKRMGGTVKVDSVEGEGTNFILKFPYLAVS